MKKISFAFFNLFLLSLCLCFAVSCTKKDDGFSIMDYSEEEIVKGNSCSKSSSFTSTVNNKTTVKCTKFSGFDKIMTIKPDGKLVKVTVSSEVTAGELRIVICDSEKVYYEFGVNESKLSYVLPSSNNKFYLKVVGNNAKYKIETFVEHEKSGLQNFEQMIL